MAKLKQLLHPKELLRLGHLGWKFFRKRGLTGTLGFAIKIFKDHGVKGALEAFHMRLAGVPPIIGEWGRSRLNPPQAILHNAPVDIIICIHNALEDVKRCLASIVHDTLPPYHLILVDDGSDQETRQFLEIFAREQGATLFRNETAGGYTLAANQGLRASKEDLVVLLNSDTIVTPYWLDRLVAAIISDKKVGLAGPLSNVASWQSIPETRINNDWAENPLPEGTAPRDMAMLLAANSPKRTPKVGLLNGFCLMLSRPLMQDIGIFDEEKFGAGYGEENDYCLRARAAGWQLVVADDAYVYHAQSKSYSHERRLELARRADEALHKKHGSESILRALGETKDNPTLAGIRARARYYVERQRLMEETKRKYEGKRVFFLLPVLHAGGGGHVILREAEALCAMGVNVTVVNLMVNYEMFEQQHPYLKVPMHYLRDPSDLKELARRADVIVATLFLTVDWLAEYVAPFYPQVKLGYYIQDFEPNFFPKENPMHQQAWESYTKLPQMKLLTKSEWNRQELVSRTGRDAEILGPSYAWNIFYPSMQKAHGRAVRVVAMVRPFTPRRAPELTMRVLKRLKVHCGDQVEIIIFGTKAKDPALKTMETDFQHINAGELSTTQVAGVLDASDVFLDFSTYQAMGLTALEAMACGVATVVPIAGGAGEFITHEETGLLIDTTNEEACFQAALRLAQDHGLREKIQQASLQSAVKYYPEMCARKLMDALCGEAA